MGNAKCPKCGATVSVQKGTAALVCPSCQTSLTFSGSSTHSTGRTHDQEHGARAAHPLPPDLPPPGHHSPEVRPARSRSARAQHSVPGNAGTVGGLIVGILIGLALGAAIDIRGLVSGVAGESASVPMVDANELVLNHERYLGKVVESRFTRCHPNGFFWKTSVAENPFLRLSIPEELGAKLWRVGQRPGLYIVRYRVSKKQTNGVIIDGELIDIRSR